jgi:D-amino-acid dehydrogenase
LTSVIVVGGGAVGLCVAESLASRGATVTVIERDRCGIGASAGNAGWITPSLAIPVPGPGVIGQSLRWLVNPSGPLWIRPTLSPAMLAWISLFVISCPRRVHRRGLAALQAAAARAAGSFDRLAERGARFELHSHELLYPAFSTEELEHLLRVAAELREAGSRLPVERVGGAEIVALERALSKRAVGGLVASGERRVRPESFNAGVGHLVRSLGGSLIEGSTVTELMPGTPVRIVASPAGEWSADAVVLANGVPATDLLRALGVRLPLVAAKGYSRTFPLSPTGPTRPVYLEQPKVAISVFEGGARVSGTLELGARRLALSGRRLRAITTAALDAMPGWEMTPDPVDWAGMRSLSPDGLPYIGAVPGCDGIYVATAHATLGITLAPLTGELLADLILERRADPLLAPFDPGRALSGLGLRRQ